MEFNKSADALFAGSRRGGQDATSPRSAEDALTSWRAANRSATATSRRCAPTRAYFARHEVDKDAKGFKRGSEGFPSPGRVAWDAWGGDPGKRWVRGIDV
jgi:hypothetical protein